MALSDRYFIGQIVFDEWKISDCLGVSVDNREATFAVYSTKGGDSNSLFKVISLYEEDSSVASADTIALVHQSCLSEFSSKASAFHGNALIENIDNYNIVDWDDGAKCGCDLILITECLDSLRNKLSSGLKFPEKDIVRIGKDVCSALILTHGHNIIHKNIKPSSIYIGMVHFKLGDFSLSNVYDNSTTNMGYYAAPEQLSQGTVSEATDIYSLGLTLYELCGGKVPLFEQATDDRGNPTLLWNEPAPLSGISTNLSNIICKACASDPTKRFATARDMLNALNNVGNPNAVQSSSRYSESAGFGETTILSQDNSTFSSSSETTVLSPSVSPYAGAGASAPIDNSGFAQVAPNSYGYAQPTPNKKKSSSGLKKVLIGVAAVLGVLIIGFVAISVLGGGDDEDEPDETEITETSKKTSQTKATTETTEVTETEPTLPPFEELSYEDYVNKAYIALFDEEPDRELVSEEAKVLEARADKCYVSQYLYNLLNSKEYKDLKKSNSEYITDLFELLYPVSADEIINEAKIEEGTHLLDDGSHDRNSVFAIYVNQYEFYKDCSAYSIQPGYFATEYTPEGTKEPIEMDQQLLAELNDIVVYISQHTIGKDIMNAHPDWFEHWIKQFLANKTDIYSFILQYATSGEMGSRNLTDEEFVKEMYRLCFRREADEGGLVGWVDALSNSDSPLPRNELVNAFLSAEEFNTAWSSYTSDVVVKFPTVVTEETTESVPEDVASEEATPEDTAETEPAESEEEA